MAYGAMLKAPRKHLGFKKFGLPGGVNGHSPKVAEGTP